MPKSLIPALAAAGLLAASQPVRAANYPLEVTNIRPAGTGGLTANYRVYRAYPGLEYNIRAAVVGGAYPYTFTLSDAPTGMTVDARGVISWPSPQASASPTLTVRDQEGSQVSATWNITVDGGSFRFVDAVNGNDANAGNQAAPWRTLSKVYSSATGTQIVYFRAGTYTVAGIPVRAQDHPQGEEFIPWDGVQKSATWLAYPGDARPTLDFGYTGSGQPYNSGDSVPRLKINGPNLYVDNMRFYRCMTMCFQVNHGGQVGTTFRRNVFDTGGPGIDGGNSAFIMFVAAGGANSLYTVVQDNEFMNLKRGTANSGLKLYTLTKPLIEDNSFHEFDAATESLAIKAAIVQYTVRGNRFYNVCSGIVGNMDDYAGGDNTRGEILFNSVIVRGPEPTWALHFNQNGTAGETFIYRNTLVGPVVAFGVGPGSGPFRLSQNVIVSEDGGSPRGSRITHYEVRDASRIVLTDNLTAPPSARIVDAAGLLQGASRTQHLGKRGHELVQ